MKCPLKHWPAYERGYKPPNRIPIGECGQFMIGVIKKNGGVEIGIDSGSNVWLTDGQADELARLIQRTRGES